MQKAGEVGVGALLIDADQNFDAVAGGDDHALGNAGHRGQRARGLGQIFARNGDALAQLDGRRLVVDSDQRSRSWGTEPVHMADEIGGPHGQHEDEDRS